MMILIENTSKYQLTGVSIAILNNFKAEKDNVLRKTK
jgi:hypothetical protein